MSHNFNFLLHGDQNTPPSNPSVDAIFAQFEANGKIIGKSFVRNDAEDGTYTIEGVISFLTEADRADYFNQISPLMDQSLHVEHDPVI